MYESLLLHGAILTLIQMRPVVLPCIPHYTKGFQVVTTASVCSVNFWWH